MGATTPAARAAVQLLPAPAASAATRDRLLHAYCSATRYDLRGVEIRGVVDVVVQLQLVVVMVE